MPFMHVDDKITARFMDTEDNERRRNLVRRIPAQIGHRLNDIVTPYTALKAPLDASWPRASVRPMPRIDGQGNVWAVKLWYAQGVAMIERGLWVTKAFPDRTDAMTWAHQQTKLRRPDQRFNEPEATC